MTTRTRFTRSKAARRGAFTLIELLVVIGIIAALMALSASAVMKFITVQQGNNTQSTLDRTQGELNKAWSKVKNAAYQESIPPGIQSAIMPSLTGTDANATARMRVIYVKLKLRQAFPMNFAEAMNPAPLPPLAVYQTYLAQYGIGGSLGANYESSACLLMALQRGVSGAGVSPEDLNKGGATGVGQGGVPYLTDAWGQPIYFTRVPAGYPLLNANPAVPGGGQAGANDPGDPQGLLNALGWPATANTALFTQLTLQPMAAQNCSYKLAPMLASSGQDKTPQFNTTWFNIVTLGGDDLFSTP